MISVIRSILFSGFPPLDSSWFSPWNRHIRTGMPASIAPVNVSAVNSASLFVNLSFFIILSSLSIPNFHRSFRINLLCRSLVADCLKFKCVQKLFRTLCRRMGKKFIRLSFFHNLSLVNKDHTVCNRPCKGHLVCDDHHRDI